MSNQITGRLIGIGHTLQIPTKNSNEPLLKREFLLDATTYDPYTGQRSEYENVLPLEVLGDKCAEFDNLNIGDVITVSFALQGRSWTNQDGEQKRMVSVRCYKIEARRPAHQQAQQTVPQPTPRPEPISRQTTIAPPPFPPYVDEYGRPINEPPF